MTTSEPKRFRAYKRDPVRAMLLKAGHGDIAELQNYLRDGGEIAVKHNLWLADVLESLQSGRHAETRGAPKRVHQDADDTAGAKRKLALLCAAYLVRRCARRELAWTGKSPSRDTTLKQLAERALEIVHKHFGIVSKKLRVSDVIGATGDRHSPHARVAHDEIVALVNSDLRQPMREMLAWHEATFIPKAEVTA